MYNAMILLWEIAKRDLSLSIIIIIMINRLETHNIFIYSDDDDLVTLTSSLLSPPVSLILMTFSSFSFLVLFSSAIFPNSTGRITAENLYL
jgi:hypothetical protein